MSYVFEGIHLICFYVAVYVIFLPFTLHILCLQVSSVYNISAICVDGSFGLVMLLFIYYLVRSNTDRVTCGSYNNNKILCIDPVKLFN